MPANLTPEYKDAEYEYRQAKDPQARLVCLEKMLSAIPKHKGTEKMQADIKRRIKQLRDSLTKKSGKKGFSVMVEKEGAAQVVLVGAPNSGKSALVEVATNARTESADHPFSTRSPVPAMLGYKNLQFQLVDMPPVSREHMEPWVIDIIRSADSTLWLIDAGDPGLESSMEEVSGLLYEKKIELVGTKHSTSFGHDPVRRIRTLVVAAKMDHPNTQPGLVRLKKKLRAGMQVLPLSALEDTDFSKLGDLLFNLHQIVRVYSKTPGKEPDLSKPHVLHQGDRLIDFARLVHKDFVSQLRYARVWGEGKHDGQRIHRDQELLDGDIVELHT